MRYLPLLTCLYLLFLAGCDFDHGQVEKTAPPEKKPSIAGTAYRPRFSVGRTTTSVGTAFCVTAPSGKLLAISASHILDRASWNAVQGVILFPFFGGRYIEIHGKPIYLGTTFTEHGDSIDGSNDFAIWEIPTNSAIPLELADRDPRVNEWVWIYGQQQNHPGGADFYRACITKSRGGSYLMRQHDSLNPAGFSGGPIFTTDGKVIGTFLSSRAEGDKIFFGGATVGSIRERIAGY